MAIGSNRFPEDFAHKKYVHEIVYTNGRAINRSRFNDVDKLSDRLGLSANEKLSQNFSIIPTKTINGISWFQFYWEYSASDNCSSYFKTILRASTEANLIKEITLRKKLNG